MKDQNSYSVFEGTKLFFQGPLDEVVLKIKKRLGKANHGDILIFSNFTGKVIDFNFHGTEKDIVRRLEVFVSEGDLKPSAGPGRPKLGVMSREVSLLPRHWEWLATQSGGASAALRALVTEAIRKESGSVSIKQAQERTYKFMSVMGGDLKGYEEALRALYKKDVEKFISHIDEWPRDIKNHTKDLAEPVFFT